MEPLAVSIKLFTFLPVAESPRIDAPDTGLRLAVRGVDYDGDALSFELLATYQLEPGFVAAFEDLTEAIVIAFEQPEGRLAKGFPTVDWHKRYPPRSGPNFTGIRPWPDGALGETGGSMVMPLTVGVPPPLLPGPSFYATALLHGYFSNTLAFDLAAGSVASFLEGKPFDPPKEGDEASGPSTGSSAGPTAAARPAPVLSLAARKAGVYASREPIPLQATLALPPDELATLGPEGWLSSLFIWTDAQPVHWLGQRAVLADDFALGAVGRETRAVATANFDLGQLMNPLGSGTHYVQVSARQYRSNVLEIACA
jgi:hypothetical protein